jgi:hypothetical protein
MSTVSEKTVSVVIPHYYPEREPNLWKIVDAFNTGTIRPLEILIWCNSPLKNRVASSNRSAVVLVPEECGRARTILGCARGTWGVCFLP